jgi:hypothetical protein
VVNHRPADLGPPSREILIHHERSQYARAVLAEVDEQAQARTGEYLAGFRRVDHLITMALAVLSEHTAYHAPVGLPADTQLTWHREGDALQVRASCAARRISFISPLRLGRQPEPVSNTLLQLPGQLRVATRIRR